MGNSINTWRQKLEQAKGRKAFILSEIRKVKKETVFEKQFVQNLEKALEIVKYVGLETQKQLQFHISSVVTLALHAVFDEAPYDFKVEFLERRNKTECDLYFSREGYDITPLEASGGGAVDVASLALRIVSWAMQEPRTRNTIIFDEPLRYLSRDKQEKASAMIKELSEKLNLQFIIVTHERDLTTYSDNVFEVRIERLKSIVK